MAWSTRELAELAGTTVNTVRHYHQLGLLAEPLRAGNGYKQYGVEHLVKLLRIRRLAELGVPLAQVGDVGQASPETAEALREIDGQLAARIDVLQQAREDIAAILAGGAPADAPAGFAALATSMSEADSSILHVYSRLYDRQALDDLREMVAIDADDPVVKEVDALAPDADEATIQSLAERVAPSIAVMLERFPWLTDQPSRFVQRPEVVVSTMVEAVSAIYNPAQLQVFARAGTLANELLAGRTGSTDSTP